MSLEVSPGETLEQFTARAAEYYATCMAAAVEVVTTAAEAMEQAPAGEVFESVAMAVTTDRIDREAGILHRVHLLGNHSIHGHDYATDGQRKAAECFEGMAVGIDHDYSSGPLSVEDTWGTVRGPIVVDAQGTWGDLHYIKTHPRTEQLLEGIERGVGNIGLSPHNVNIARQGRTIIGFTPRRVDVVIGAATTKGVFEQAGATNEFQQLRAEMKEIREMLTKKTSQFEQAPPKATALQETIDATTSGIDLTKHWND